MRLTVKTNAEAAQKAADHFVQLAKEGYRPVIQRDGGWYIVYASRMTAGSWADSEILDEGETFAVNWSDYPRNQKEKE